MGSSPNLPVVQIMAGNCIKQVAGSEFTPDRARTTASLGWLSCMDILVKETMLQDQVIVLCLTQVVHVYTSYPFLLTFNSTAH